MADYYVDGLFYASFSFMVFSVVVVLLMPVCTKLGPTLIVLESKGPIIICHRELVNLGKFLKKRPFKEVTLIDIFGNT